MRRDQKTELRVGVFVMVALFIGGTLALVIGEQRNVFTQKTEFDAYFEQVDGLSPGSPVRIAGVDVGTVRDVRLVESGRIHVTFGIIEDATNLVRADSIASVGNKGLLGDKLLDITVGTGAALAEGATLQTETPIGLGEYLERAGGIIAEVEATATNLRIATEPLAEEQFGNDLRETTANLAVITRMAANPDGALAHLLSDADNADRIDRSLTNVETASRELAGAARSARRIVAEVESGDGSAHEIIYGDQGTRLVTNLADMTGEVATLLLSVREGEGLIHELVYEDSGGELLANLEGMSEDMRAVTADIRAGRGTLGGLLTDPSIYEDVKRLVGNLERNDILRALVRYSIRQDDAEAPVPVTPVTPVTTPQTPDN
jgi:phospholipid/cholesterol/gamma-HCH transport system substrate-binding protein